MRRATAIAPHATGPMTVLLASILLAACNVAGPTPSASPSGGPSAAPGRSVVINNAPRTRRQVALTFDSDSEGGHGLEIVEWLAAHRTPATIFMTGDWTDHRAEGPKILAIIEAHPDLFTLGNHSYSHPHFDQLTPEQMRAELRQAAASFLPHTRQDPRPFWRPPYGELDDRVLDAAGAEGYRWTVLADVGLPDWRPLDFDPPGWTAAFTSW